jgi:glycosyltransferase involved in cell wall biosynthesis
MSTSLVSIIIPVYNGERFLKATLESVFAQTFKDYEVICVDDGSTDRSSAVISEISSAHTQPVRLLRQHRGGQSAARNMGARNSSGQYLAFLDQDDIWYPTKLERQVEVLETRQAAVLVHSDHDLIDETGRVLQRNVASAARNASDKGLVTRLLGPHAWIFPSLLMARKSAFIQIGGFDPELRFDEDADLCMRMHELGESVFLDEVGGAHREHTASASKRTDFADEHLRNGERFYRKLERHYAEEPHKLRLVHLILATKLSDWGWHKVRAGEWGQGVRLLARAVSYDPFCLRTYSRILRSFMQSRSALARRGR